MGKVGLFRGKNSPSMSLFQFPIWVRSGIYIMFIDVSQSVSIPYMGKVEQAAAEEAARQAAGFNSLYG